jgi:hypothetical protein
MTGGRWAMKEGVVVMRNLIKAALLIALPLVCMERASAQATDPQIPQLPPATIEGKFAVAHNEAKDQTVVALLHKPVGGDKSCGLYVTAAFLYYGKASFPPKLIMISFSRINTEEPRFLKQAGERELTLNVDGELMKLGSMNSVKEIVIGYSLFEQGLMLPLPYETFIKIAKAKKADAKIGPLSFKLSEDNLKDFRDLADRMKD